MSVQMQRHPRISGSHYRPDGRWKDVVVEIKSRVHSFRNLRASLLQMAYWLAQEPTHRALLVLVSSRITDARLKAERALAAQTLKPEIFRRLTIVVERDSAFRGVPEDLGAGFHEWLSKLVRKETGERGPRLSAEDVLVVMLHQWLLRKGLMTTEWIKQTVGCSYPTVAGTLRRLGNMVERSSDRRVKLSGFPAEELDRLVANARAWRPTLRYADRSGQRRSPESLLRRAAKLGRSDLAVGGVIGARHYHPDLDLRGTPRLDLAVHSPEGRADLSFVEQLDPALERTDPRDGSVALAVHLVRRREPLFQPGEDGIAWVDPLGCLLDLYDARLEAQAREFRDFLVSGVG